MKIAVIGAGAIGGMLAVRLRCRDMLSPLSNKARTWKQFAGLA